MTKIDTNRVSSILRLLSSEKTGDMGKHIRPAIESALAIESDESKRDKYKLRQRIKYRLKSINSNDKNFHYSASVGTIKEVLLWEFSDEFVSHPEFALIVEHITKQILSSVASRAAMDNLIQSMVAEDN